MSPWSLGTSLRGGFFFRTATGPSRCFVFGAQPGGRPTWWAWARALRGCRCGCGWASRLFGAADRRARRRGREDEGGIWRSLVRPPTAKEKGVPLLVGDLARRYRRRSGCGFSRCAARHGICQHPFRRYTTRSTLHGSQLAGTRSPAGSKTSDQA